MHKCLGLNEKKTKKVQEKVRAVIRLSWCSNSLSDTNEPITHA
jgi:hypothetical protein